MRYNEGDIERHLKRITSRWNELSEEACFEIRCIKENGAPAWKHFKVEQIDEAVQYAIRHNENNYNVYTTVNPITTDIIGGDASKDHNALGSFFCFCDCDTPESVDNYNTLYRSGFKANFAVYTGMKPKRGHLYFELDTFTQDMEEWSAMQRSIANKLDSDPVVNNPSRILRLAGTVSYPDTRKKNKGRVVEVTEFRNYRTEKKSVKQLRKVFPSKTETAFRINLDDMTQRERLDIEDSLRRIRAGDGWHDNMIRVVASLVSRGRTDQEIHTILSDITLSGYTLADTVREVDKAIEGARNKGFTGIDRAEAIREEFVKNTAVITDMFQFWELRDPIAVPQREWLYGNHYIKDYYSLTVSPGGVGKSTLILTEVLAMCTGRALLGIDPIKKIKALYYNAEDPYDEVLRRVMALCQHYDIKQSELTDSLMIASGRDVDMTLMAGVDGIINEPLINQLADIISSNNIELLVLDPLANMITSSESVENFSRLSKALSLLADRCNISIEIVHHTRKMSENREASIEDSRGGGSLVAGSRSGRILQNMSKKDATELGIDNYVDYFKIEPAGKNNLSRPLDKVEWYKKIGVQIPNSDWVAVTEKWTVPNAFDGISEHQCQLLWDAIKQEELYLCSHILTKKDEYKTSIHDYIAEFLGMDIDAPVSKKKIKSIIKTWLDADVLVEDEVNESQINPKSYRHSKVVKVIKVGSVRPGI